MYLSWPARQLKLISNNFTYLAWDAVPEPSHYIKYGIYTPLILFRQNSNKIKQNIKSVRLHNSESKRSTQIKHLRQLLWAMTVERRYDLSVILAHCLQILVIFSAYMALFVFIVQVGMT